MFSTKPFQHLKVGTVFVNNYLHVIFTGGNYCYSVDHVT